MNRTYLRGDMYFVDLGQGIGSEQEGNRLVVIIQNDVGNRHSPTVIVAAITTRKESRGNFLLIIISVREMAWSGLP